MNASGSGLESKFMTGQPGLGSWCLSANNRPGWHTSRCLRPGRGSGRSASTLPMKLINFSCPPDSILAPRVDPCAEYFTVLTYIVDPVLLLQIRWSELFFPISRDISIMLLYQIRCWSWNWNWLLFQIDVAVFTVILIFCFIVWCDLEILASIFC